MHEHHLKILSDKGFRPDNVLDIGAHAGSWSLSARPFFPHSRFLMFEAQSCQEADLSKASKDINGEFAIVLLGAENKSSVFYQMPVGNSTGSSIFKEIAFEGSPHPEEVFLPMRRLDDVLYDDKEVEGSFFMKLDVQGAELEVLKGGPLALTQSEVILLEVAHLPYNEGAPLMSEVVEFMHERGFIMHSVWEEYGRHNVVYQSDFLFMRKDSELR